MTGFKWHTGVQGMEYIVPSKDRGNGPGKGRDGDCGGTLIEMTILRTVQSMTTVLYVTKNRH